MNPTLFKVMAPVHADPGDYLVLDVDASSVIAVLVHKTGEMTVTRAGALRKGVRTELIDEKPGKTPKAMALTQSNRASVEANAGDTQTRRELVLEAVREEPGLKVRNYAEKLFGENYTPYQSNRINQDLQALQKLDLVISKIPENSVAAKTGDVEGHRVHRTWFPKY